MATVEALELSFDSQSERRLSSLWEPLAALYHPQGEGVVFLRPSPSGALRAAHEACTRALGEDARLVHPYYRAEHWVPHCTMAVGVPPSAMDAVVQQCQRANALGMVTVCRASFVRYRPTSELHTAALGARALP